MLCMILCEAQVCFRMEFHDVHCADHVPSNLTYPKLNSQLHFLGLPPSDLLHLLLAMPFFQGFRPNSLDSCLYLTPHIQAVMIFFCCLYLPNICRISPLFTTSYWSFPKGPSSFTWTTITTSQLVSLLTPWFPYALSLTQQLSKTF